MYTSKVSEDFCIDIEVIDHCTIEEVREIAAALLAKADEAEKAKSQQAEREKFGVFFGAKPGDLFVTDDGTLFMLADPTAIHYAIGDGARLWRLTPGAASYGPTHATADYWTDSYGHKNFRPLASGLLLESTFDRRNAYVVGEGVL